MSDAPNFISAEAYLEMAPDSEEKYEYHDGTHWAMSGGSYQHSIICSNVNRRVAEKLDDKPGYYVFESNLKVYIPEYSNYLFPDASITCGNTRFAEGRNDVLLNPVLIIEVLSPSTEIYDRRDKFEKYRSLVSLREYVLKTVRV